MSPTVQTLVLGGFFLSICVGYGWLRGKKAGAARQLLIFFPIWLVYCLFHMYRGVSHGYSIAQELPFLGINFGIPALAAYVLYRFFKNSRS